MKLRGRRILSGGRESGSFLPRLIFLAICFAAGVILGQVLSVRVADDVSGELVHYLSSFFSLSDGENSASGTLLSTLVVYYRYPLLAFLFGFASVGVVLLPLLSAAYGFFLSFSVCCFTAAFGSDGVLLALCVFGLRCLITLPCYFLLAVPSFRNAVSLAAISLGREARDFPIRYGSVWWMRLCIAAGVLLAGALAEQLLSPCLLSLARSRILS